MNDLDEQILAALKAEDAEVLSRYGSDGSIHESMIELYQGQRKWFNLFLTLCSLGLFGMMLFCGHRFFNAESTRDMIAWATGCLLLVLWLVMLKLWFWLEMLKNSVTREVKRVELQIALLNRSQKNQDS